MFRGFFSHTMDSKGRVSVPSVFREHMHENYGDTFIITRFQKCLVAYPLKEWQSMEKKLAQLPQMKPEVQQFQRYFLSGASHCPIDKHGRILLPAFLRDYAKLEKDLVFVGMLKKIEIWSQELWQDAFAASESEFEAVAAVMADLGI